MLSPSDLLGRRRLAGTLTVGGRVLGVGTTGLVIADALANVSVDIAPSGVKVGDLVVIEGVFRNARLARARLLGHHSAPEPVGRGETARLSFERVGPRLMARARAFAIVREYFDEQGFLEVDTPVRVRTPGLDVHVDALRAEGGWLVTSPEFHMKRLLVGGLPRIYQVVHCFRRDEAGSWHQPEFAMLEFYRAFAGVSQVMDDTEHAVTRVVRGVAGSAVIRAPGGPVEVRRPFERMSVREAFRRYAGVADCVDLAAEDEGRFFELLLERVEPALARAKRPIFLHSYPISQASLARPVPGAPELAERFELYLGGIELSNGFGELTDPEEQRRRFRADLRARRRLRRPTYPLDERFLWALEEGMPPAAGNALGLDRLIALACGAPDIAAVQAFPGDRV